MFIYNLNTSLLSVVYYYLFMLKIYLLSYSWTSLCDIYLTVSEVFLHLASVFASEPEPGADIRTYVCVTACKQSGPVYKSLENTLVSCSSHLAVWNTVMVEMTFKVECRNSSRKKEKWRGAEKVLVKEQLRDIRTKRQIGDSKKERERKRE